MTDKLDVLDDLKVCNYCKHWYKLQLGNEGVCYAIPPIARREDKRGVWPKTSSIDFCGMWQLAGGVFKRIEEASDD